MNLMSKQIRSVAILDVDGTLVDTNYQHTIAWQRAFRQHEIVLPAWRIHRHIGMGGDKLVAALAGEHTDAEQGDDIRAAEKVLYTELIEEVELMPGARRLIDTLKERGKRVVLASSAKAEEIEHYLDLLDARDVIDEWTSSADVEATKPDPDLVHAAIDKVGCSADDAVMVGDTTWDCIAAAKADVPTIGVLSGGFSEQELLDAGAVAVYPTPTDLVDQLGDTPLG
jgi:HAD superfamily hydrolase (TIGR01509 family)